MESTYGFIAVGFAILAGTFLSGLAALLAGLYSLLRKKEVLGPNPFDRAAVNLQKYSVSIMGGFVTAGFLWFVLDMVLRLAHSSSR